MPVIVRCEYHCELCCFTDKNGDNWGLCDFDGKYCCQDKCESSKRQKSETLSKWRDCSV